MRILLITSDKYPFHRPAAKVLFCGELMRKGHTVDTLAQAQDDCSTRGKVSFGGATIFLTASNSGRKVWHRLVKNIRGFAGDFRALYLVCRYQYDIVQVKDKYLGGLIALLACRLGGAAFCYWIAWPYPEAQLYAARQGTARYRMFSALRGRALRPLLYRYLLPRCDHIFVQSEQMKRDFVNEGIPENKLTAIPGSLDLEAVPYDTVNTAVGRIYPNDKRAIVYLGTLMRIRHLEILVQAFARVRNTHPDAVLYLLGEGEVPEDEAALLRECERLGVSNSVVLTGFLPMTVAWEYIRRADVCASPYYPTPILNSTSPTKLIEYMAMGRPVVGNDHPEQIEVIERSGAGIVVGWNATEFADAIMEILANGEHWDEMGRRGRDYVVRNRTNSVMADIVEKIYTEVA